MQNLSAGDQQKLANDVKNISSLGFNDDTMALILGLNLMTYVGSNVLQQAVNALGSNIKGLPPPKIRSVAPPSVPGAASATLTITCDAFISGAVVWINGALCPNAKVTGPSTITCDTPAGPQKAGAASTVIARPRFPRTDSPIPDFIFLTVPFEPVILNSDY